MSKWVNSSHTAWERKRTKTSDSKRSQKTGTRSDDGRRRTSDNKSNESSSYASYGSCYSVQSKPSSRAPTAPSSSGRSYSTADNRSKVSSDCNYSRAPSRSYDTQDNSDDETVLPSDSISQIGSTPPRKAGSRTRQRNADFDDNASGITYKSHTTYQYHDANRDYHGGRVSVQTRRAPQYPDAHSDDRATEVSVNSRSTNDSAWEYSRDEAHKAARGIPGRIRNPIPIVANLHPAEVWNPHTVRANMRQNYGDLDSIDEDDESTVISRGRR